jgi:hypothetical protein
MGREGGWQLGEIYFIHVVQKDKGVEYHHIELLSYERLTQMYSSTKHWDKIVDDPKYKVDEEWEHFFRV